MLNKRDTTAMVSLFSKHIITKAKHYPHVIFKLNGSEKTHLLESTSFGFLIPRCELAKRWWSCGFRFRSILKNTNPPPHGFFLIWNCFIYASRINVSWFCNANTTQLWLWFSVIPDGAEFGPWVMLWARQSYFFWCGAFSVF